MDFPNLIQSTVKVLTITAQKQKLRFQLRHPEKAESIIGIAVTCTLLSDDSSKGNTAGDLALWVPQKGDVFYGDDVKVDNNEFNDLLSQSINDESVSVSESSKRDYFLTTCHPVQKAILEGFYEDLFSPELNGHDGIPKPFLYKVRIYLRYKLVQESKPDQP